MRTFAKCWLVFVALLFSTACYFEPQFLIIPACLLAAAVVLLTWTCILEIWY
jgi:hypothetical protein